MTTYADLYNLPDKGLVYNLQAQVTGVGPVNAQVGRDGGTEYYCWMKLKDSTGVEFYADLYPSPQDVAGLGQPPNLERVIKGQVVTISAYTSGNRLGGAQKITGRNDGAPRLRLRGLRALGLSPQVQMPANGPQPAQAPRSASPQGGSTRQESFGPPKPSWAEQEALVVESTWRLYLHFRSLAPETPALERPSPDACLAAAEAIAVHLSISERKGEIQRPPIPAKPSAGTVTPAFGTENPPVTGGSAQVPTPWGPVPGPENAGGAEAWDDDIAF